MPAAESSIVDEAVRGYVPDPSFLSLAGVERLRTLIDGIPRSPIQHLTGLNLVQVGSGSCTWTMPASPWFQTEAGFFLSGVTGLVADAALSGAIVAALPAWTYPVTSDINFTYMRPVRVDAGKLIAKGRIVEVGRSQGTAEALIEDGDGRLLAHATTRCFVRDVEPQEVTFEVPSPAASWPTPDPFERPFPADLPIPGDVSDLSGLEVVRRVLSGDVAISPFNLLIGTRMREAEEGRVEMTCPASPWFQSAAGTIYGGLLALFADGLTTAVATTVLASATAAASLDLKVHFLRPGIADGRPLTGRGQVVHGGKGLIVARSEILTADGKPLVIATGSFMRRRIRDWVPVER